MKITANKKVITLILALVLSLIGCMFAQFASVSADETETVVTSSDYFTVTEKDGTTNSDLALSDDSLVLVMGDGSSAEFKRDLLLSDFETAFAVDGTYTTVEFVLSYNSRYVNGVINTEGDETTYVTSIKNSVSLNIAGGKATVDGVEKDVTFGGTITVKTAITADTFTVTVNGVAFDVTSSSLSPEVFGGNVVGRIGFKTTATADEAGKISVSYIDQKASDAEHAYKQTFVLTAGEVTSAKSVVLLNKGFYNSREEGVIEKRYYENHTLSFSEYSVVRPTLTSSDFKVGIEEQYQSAVKTTGTTTKSIRLAVKDTEAEFRAVSGTGDDEVVHATFKIKGVADSEKPEYVADSAALEAFKYALDKATREEYEIVGENGVTETVERSIRLGSSNYLDIPSMSDLVKDNLYTYSDLSYTVYYRSTTSDWSSTSSFKIPVATEGRYEFYVVFADKSPDKNTMERSDFVNDDGEIEGALASYVFSFNVLNDAPITVSAAAQEKAYKGIQYTASSFTILALNYSVEYTLWYSADGESNWTEIPAIADLDEDSAEYKRFRDYAYDGNLTFTPAVLGYYRIDADIFENGSTRSASASAIIEANSTPSRVVPNENNWFLNNVWSLVFLTTGTLSLIGIIVVLCIKPKEEGEVSSKK